MMNKSSECVEKVTRSTSPWYTELSICRVNDIGLVAGYFRDQNLCLDYMETWMQNIKDLCADEIISYIKI